MLESHLIRCCWKIRIFHVCLSQYSGLTGSLTMPPKVRLFTSLLGHRMAHLASIDCPASCFLPSMNFSSTLKEKRRWQMLLMKHKVAWYMRK